jgi:hypothetical protein
MEQEINLHLHKKKIIATLPPNQELESVLYNTRLYSAGVDGEDWLFSGLEGKTAIVVDYQIKTRYIMMFNQSNYGIIFKYELYNEFEKYFQELAPEFRAFEIDSGFLGLQFENPDQAKKFEGKLKNILTKKKEITKPAESSKDQSKFKEYCKILKELFQKSNKKYDEKYAEDGMQILKHKNFKVLNNISYNKNKKRFELGKISGELKEMFSSFGIKKKDLEKDMDFAFSLFKRVIVALGKESKLQNSSLDSISHSFPPPAEREILRKKEEEAARRRLVRRTIKKKPKRHQSFAQGSKKGMKTPSLGPSRATIALPKGKKIGLARPTISQKRPSISLDKNEEEDKNDLDESERDAMAGLITKELEKRRVLLHMHDPNDDDDDDDWDD